MILFWDFMIDGDYWDYTTTTSCLPEPSRIKKKKVNIFTKVRWFMLVQIWKFNNRKWNNCRQKNKALDKYKRKIMKGREA